MSTEIEFEQAGKEIKAWLVEELKELDFSVRAQNVFTAHNLKSVADLIEFTEADLFRMPNCGRKTVHEINSFFSRLGLFLDTKVSGLDPESASELQAKLRRRKKTAKELDNEKMFRDVLDAANSLGEELISILAIETSDRNVQLVSKLWGWFGKRPRTLESVGNEFNITRERVRQIAAKVSRKIRKRSLVTPFLIKAAILIRQSCPATAPTLNKKLREAKISTREIHPLGVAKACEMFEIPLGLTVINLGESSLYSIEDIEIPFVEFQREARRRTSANGCLNFNALCHELGILDLYGERIWSLLSDTKEFVWLNDERSWFYSSRPTRNRLLNLASKVLYACPKLRSNELRRAVVKSRRLEVKPPVEVLERLVQASGLATIEEGYLVADQRSVEPLEPGSIEDKFVNILRDHGPAISGSEFEEHCIQAGINPISFYIYRSMSPVVSQLVPGVYSLVGATAPPGMIEEIASKSRKSTRITERGWDKEGQLWCAFSLSRAVIVAGSIPLPNFVSGLVQGNWMITLPDGTQAGEATCRNNFLFRLRKPLQFLGAEPGDLILFRFNLHSRFVLTEIGGTELIEAAESGDLDQKMDD